MHGHIICMFMAYQRKRKKKKILIQHVKDKHANKHGRKILVGMKQDKTEAYEIKVFRPGPDQEVGQ